MTYILPMFLSLVQYKIASDTDLDLIRPDYCISCGRAHPWRHGPYPRKPHRDRGADESLNPILIQRYFCPGCEKTFSVLPECIPPRRWYPWEVQQAILLLFLLGHSAYEIAKESIPSYKTITRWFQRFQDQFRLHRDTLCSHFGALARTSSFADFWIVCFKQMTLGAAMRLCHVAGVPVP